MTHLRLWILGAALGSFAAGMNVGLAAPKLLAAEDPRAAAEDEYLVEKMVADYGLTGQQEKSLRLVLQKGREEEIGAFRSTEFRLLPSSIQSQLLQARSRMEKRIRAILDEEQRARYDLASRPK